MLRYEIIALQSSLFKIKSLLQYFVSTNSQIIFVCSIDIDIPHFFTFMLNSTHRHIQQFMVGHVIFGHDVSYILAHNGPTINCHCICYIINNRVSDKATVL